MRQYESLRIQCPRVHSRWSVRNMKGFRLDKWRWFRKVRENNWNEVSLLSQEPLLFSAKEGVMSIHAKSFKNSSFIRVQRTDSKRTTADDSAAQKRTLCSSWSAYCTESCETSIRSNYTTEPRLINARTWWRRVESVAGIECLCRQDKVYQWYQCSSIRYGIEMIVANHGSKTKNLRHDREAWRVKGGRVRHDKVQTKAILCFKSPSWYAPGHKHH